VVRSCTDFTGDGDAVRYDLTMGSAGQPREVLVKLLHQPIAFRWAKNLSQYNALETKRFVEYYESASSASAVVMARAVARVG
jgi:hypothetical protein